METYYEKRFYRNLSTQLREFEINRVLDLMKTLCNKVGKLIMIYSRRNIYFHCLIFLHGITLKVN